MIDTIRLNLTDCEVKKGAALSILPAAIDNSTGKKYGEHDLFIDLSGRIVTGSKAFMNHDKFNLTIQPTVTSEINEFNKSVLKHKRFKRIDEKLDADLFDYNSEDQVQGIFVQTSLPRLLNETNLKTLTADEQKKALLILEDLLKANGIRTNIFDANISRLDTFTNLKTNYNFNYYSDLFSKMQCTRMRQVGYADESFLWKNGNIQLMVYDKILELKRNKPKLKFSEKNVMRIENRLLKKRSIYNKLRFVKLNEVYNSYQDLKDFHINQVQQNIFKYKLDLVEIITDDNLQQIITNAKNIFGRKYFNMLFNYAGIYFITGNIKFEVLADIIDEVDAADSIKKRRIKKTRLKKMIEQSNIYFGSAGVFTKAINKKKNNIELYKELKNKFYKEVA